MTIGDLEGLLVKDSSIEVSQDKWYKNMLEAKIAILKTTYNLKSTSNKRESVYAIDPFYNVEVFTDTRPYWYNNIQISQQVSPLVLESRIKIS